MSCMLATACLYLDVALGVRDNDDVERLAEFAPKTMLTEKLTGPNPQGRVRIGIIHDTGLYLEATHQSSVVTGEDAGQNSAFAGLRWTF